ncbi:MAG: sigma-70 family RNA polymerase sigma factor [Ruminococcus sp.]|nr:sigma-70 family RNA polymerase sigma factor [Ruminococcus sp.]
MCKLGLTDEQILAAETSEKAFEILSERYTKRVIAAARTFSHGSGIYGDLDDLIQEGLIALFRAVLTYDETKGAKFSTYAYACIRNRISDAANREAAQIETAWKQAAEYAAEHGAAVTDEMPDFIAMSNELQGFRDVLSDAAKNLTKLEQSVLSLRRDDVSYADIAKLLGISEKSVDNAYYRAKRKLIKYLQN